MKKKYRIINYNLPYGNYGLYRGSKYYGTFFFLTNLENTIYHHHGPIINTIIIENEIQNTQIK